MAMKRKAVKSYARKVYKRKYSKKRNQTQGDIPRPPKADWMTASCSVPSVSDTFVYRTVTETGTGLIASGLQQTPNYIFSLSDIDDVTNLTNVFDQYRIEAVRLMIRPMNSATGLLASGTLVNLYSVIDYDNVASVTSIADIREYDNCIIAAPTESVCRTFRPRVALGAYSGTFTGFANVESPWIDCSSPGVQHYGVKMLIPASTSSSNFQQWTVEREYFIRFKKVHG